MAFLTMEVEVLFGGSDGSRFPPCFSWVYAALPSRSTCSLTRPEWPRGAPHLSPRPVPNVSSIMATLLREATSQLETCVMYAKY